jgi:alkyl sulfatase BDS1-like metallo-beta-lactamase superfamily hydrolase
MHAGPESFETDDSRTESGPLGQRAHRELIEHGARFERRLWQVCEGVWCLVGNGLSNQTFVLAPQGLIVIDTGDSVEEMRSALAEIRRHTDAPVAAVIYTHFHYVGGTTALLGETGDAPLLIWAHAGLVANRRRTTGAIGPTYSRGLAHQFGILLPADGEDGLLNVGLGMAFRNAAHAPHTPGFIAPTHTFDTPVSVEIAGLAIEFTPAPSDADDSVTIWIPALGVCVNNLVWPTLFNVFPIRGEAYRDPRILLVGIDHLQALFPEHLLGAHGPPISGRERIQADVIDYRDAIQFMWDQTVRGLNRGLTGPELTRFVVLPERFRRTYLTRQYYGLVEHHVRQIQAGLIGWFDGNEADLFPVAPPGRAQRLIEGFGGRDAVHAQAQAAFEAGDLRWALELSSWLVRCELDAHGRADAGRPADRALMARVLRTLATRTTSANLRNWCLTRARELDGVLDLGRFRTHRFRIEDVLASPPATFVEVLSVMLDPARAAGLNAAMRWDFADGTRTAMLLRDGVAVPVDADVASMALALDLKTWARLLAGRTTLSAAVADGSVRIDGEMDAILSWFRCFDHTALGA